MTWPLTTSHSATAASTYRSGAVQKDDGLDWEFYEHRCPECGSRQIVKDFRETFLDRVLWLRLGLPAYVCTDCACRFLDRPIPSAVSRRARVEGDLRLAR